MVSVMWGSKFASSQRCGHRSDTVTDFLNVLYTTGDVVAVLKGAFSAPVRPREPRRQLPVSELPGTVRARGRLQGVLRAARWTVLAA